MAMDALEGKLCKFIESRHRAMVDDVRRFVAIPTGMGHAPGLDEFRGLMCERLAALGAKVDLIPGQPRPKWLEHPPSEAAEVSPPPVLRAVHRPKSKLPRVLITGHLDTVHDPNGSFRELSI